VAGNLDVYDRLHSTWVSCQALVSRDFDSNTTQHASNQEDAAAYQHRIGMRRRIVGLPRDSESKPQKAGGGSSPQAAPRYCFPGFRIVDEHTWIAYINHLIEATNFANHEHLVD